jgi:carbon starvation protein
MAWWYHFAVLFEALFILTTIDAGTRVGRFIVQGLLGTAWKRFHDVSWLPGAWLCSALVAGGWGWFLIAGVNDPRGGIYTLWPVFGLANQVLAAIALCVGTAIIVRMGKARYAFVTVIPLIWLIVVTESAGIEKLFSPAADLGFVAQAHAFELKAAALDALGAGGAAAAKNHMQVLVLHRQAFNARLDAGLCAAFMLAIVVVALDTLRECWSCLHGGRLRGSSPVLMTTPEVSG